MYADLSTSYYKTALRMNGLSISQRFLLFLVVELVLPADATDSGSFPVLRESGHNTHMTSQDLQRFIISDEGEIRFEQVEGKKPENI